MPKLADLPPGLVPLSSFDRGPTVAATLIALESLVPGGIATLTGVIPPSPSNPINVWFYHGAFVPVGGVVYNFISITFPAIDMGVLISNAYAADI